MEYWWGFGWGSGFDSGNNKWWHSGPLSNERRMDGWRGNPNHNRRPKGKFCKKYADDRQKAFSRKGRR